MWIPQVHFQRWAQFIKIWLKNYKKHQLQEKKKPVWRFKHKLRDLIPKSKSTILISYIFIVFRNNLSADKLGTDSVKNSNRCFNMLKMHMLLLILQDKGS